MAENVGAGSAVGEISGPLWWTGWRPVVTPVVCGFAGLALGNAIAIPVGILLGIHTLVTMGVFTVLGLLLGIGAWYRGTREINRGFRTMLETYRDGAAATTPDVTTYALVTEGTGAKLLVEPHRRYLITYLTLGESSLTVSQGPLDVAERRPELDGDVIDLPYDRIDSVAYEQSTVEIRTGRGDRFRYESEHEPVKLIRDLRERLRGRPDA